MKINELGLRNTTKKNLVRGSKKALQYDFLVKKGITQDDIGFMSILDVPVLNLLTGKECTLDEYIQAVTKETIKLQEQVQELDGKYQVLETEYKRILEMGTAEYIAELLNL